MRPAATGALRGAGALFPGTATVPAMGRPRRSRARARTAVVDLVHGVWDRAGVTASITTSTRRSRRFAAFGEGSLMCFPWAALYGEAGIRIGRGTMIGPFVSLSAGMVPGQQLVSDAVVYIGDR